jgi:hypothetical protein
MSVFVPTLDFFAWCEARDLDPPVSFPVAWGMLAIYDHEREEGIWPSGSSAAPSLPEREDAE